MQVLVINAGSSSVKYRIVHAETGAVSFDGAIERIGQEKTHREAFQELLAAVGDREIDAVGHRVVHGGSKFTAPTLIDDEVIETIRSLIPMAPLHNPHNLAGIEAAKQALPNLPQVAVFDTAFSSKLPRRARTYAIDQDLAEEYGIVRYGFHGTSHAYVASLAAEAMDRPLDDLRIISLHLGNGTSACAIEHGHATETSMGMTPLEGLVMGTRGGDFDPGAIMALARAGKSFEEIDRLLNHESGLKGLSGISNDMRDILEKAEEGDERCRLAIGVFAHRVRKYIGAYAATMGGVDAIVLTAGIGENSAQMRRRILQRFDFLGLTLSEDRNQNAKLSEESPVAWLTDRRSRVAAFAIRTNEELAIAQKTAAIARGEQKVHSDMRIPIAVSARHCHLDRATVDALFGEGYELTKSHDISQPGQFACEERINLIGPRGRIDGVRVLGPLRSQTQVEISRTDEFRLGVDAPIRDSGQLAGSAPITVEGPKGIMHLKEGLICAKRHIHMHTDDAARFGLKDKDEVDVKISSGPRPVIFGDVLVRVSPNFKLEMHIDTDEGNAIEFNKGAMGDLVYRAADSDGASVLTRRIQTGRQ